MADTAKFLTAVAGAGSRFLTAKNELSSTMQLSIMRARPRICINSPPLSLFNPEPVRVYCLENGHQLARTISEKRLVLQRIRKEESPYNCKIYN